MFFAGSVRHYPIILGYNSGNVLKSCSASLSLSTSNFVLFAHSEVDQSTKDEKVAQAKARLQVHVDLGDSDCSNWRLSTLFELVRSGCQAILNFFGWRLSTRLFRPFFSWDSRTSWARLFWGFVSKNESTKSSSLSETIWFILTVAIFNAFFETIYCSSRTTAQIV